MPSRDESHVTSTAARFTTLRFACLGASRHCAATGDVLTQPRQDARPLCVANRLGMAWEETRRAQQGAAACEAGFTPRFPSVCWWRCRSPDPRRETRPPFPVPFCGAASRKRRNLLCGLRTRRGPARGETPPSHSKHREAIDRPSMGWEASETSDAQLPAGRARTAKQQACVRIPAALHIFYAYTDAALRRSTFGAPGQPCVTHPPPLVSCSRHGVQFCCAALPVRFFSGKHFGDDVRAASPLGDMGRRHAAQQTRGRIYSTVSLR